MHKNLKYYLFILFTALGLFASTCQADVNTPKQTSFMFVQNANYGILKTNKAKPQHYKFVLKDVSPYVIYFSDRPTRVSGLITPDKFIKLWQKNPGMSNSFAKDAPNVGINAMKMHSILNKKDYSFVMELNHPVYDSAKHTLVYDAKIVPGANSFLPTKDIKFKDVVLFFDNIMDPCTDSKCCPMC